MTRPAIGAMVERMAADPGAGFFEFRCFLPDMAAELIPAIQQRLGPPERGLFWPDLPLMANLAHVCIASGQCVEALAVLEKLHLLCMQHKCAWRYMLPHLRVLAYLNMNDFDAAETALREARSLASQLLPGDDDWFDVLRFTKREIQKRRKDHSEG